MKKKTRKQLEKDHKKKLKRVQKAKGHLFSWKQALNELKDSKKDKKIQ